ncbi:MAG: GTP cyclohydrolase II [Rhodospirillales bacterium]|nr:MAG: GTP cyclohydrolase II [Rhodospirillales bacterium]
MSLAPSDIETVPAEPPVSLVPVERAMAELRRGGVVLIHDADGAAGLVVAAESCGDAALARLRGLASDAPALVTTRRRAEAVGIEIPPHIAGGMGAANKPVTLDLPAGVPVAVILEPTAPDQRGHVAARYLSRPVASHAPAIAEAAIELAKLARLMPAVVVGPLPRDRLREWRDWAAARDALYVEARDVRGYEKASAFDLRPVADARVPLENAENARIVAWRPQDGGKEHLAIVVGEIDPTRPVLIRLHSECFTGDLLGSLRCDCGEQLRGAIAEIARAGSGVLLYLAQEGRGIGLVNKLRAYRLQDSGFDTVDANEQLGFESDERMYWPAAVMLRQMGIARVRLMTNNPEKIDQLGDYGIEVVERVPHVFPANGHNEKYLRTKAEKSGHLL